MEKMCLSWKIDCVILLDYFSFIKPEYSRKCNLRCCHAHLFAAAVHEVTVLLGGRWTLVRHAKSYDTSQYKVLVMSFYTFYHYYITIELW